MKGKNNIYAVTFFFMEIFNLLNLLVQMGITNVFLQGRFINYGSRVLNHVHDLSIGSGGWNWNPMDEVFPKIAKCQFNKHGVGGGIQVEYRI